MSLSEELGTLRQLFEDFQAWAEDKKKIPNKGPVLALKISLGLIAFKWSIWPGLAVESLLKNKAYFILSA